MNKYNQEALAMMRGADLNHAPHKGGVKFIPEPDCPDCIHAIKNYDALLTAMKGLTKIDVVYRGPLKGAIIVGPQGWRIAQAAIKATKS